MSGLSKLSRKLDELYSGNVTFFVSEGILTLSGQVEKWDDLVSAGLLAAKYNRGLCIVNNIACKNAALTAMKMPLIQDALLEGEKPDVLVIGAGIVGCAVARELMRYDVSVLLIDKENDVAMHASSRNDGAVHPGIDLKKGQVKQTYNLRGNRMYDKVARELGVDFKRIGQYVCFNNSLLKTVYPIVKRKWEKVGVPSKFVSRSKMREIEPTLGRNTKWAVFFPTAGIVCPYQMTIAYAENAVDNGAKLSLETAVVDILHENGKIKAVVTNRGTLYPKVVVNCAGVFCEDIAKMAGDHFYSIHPRRGTNIITDKKAARKSLVTISSYGTVNKKVHSKGGGIMRTVDDNLLIGPDAFETNERENFETTRDSVSQTLLRQGETVPSLSSSDVITYFTGVRAATYEEDFVITNGKFIHNLVHAAGIQSPGVTAAPAIGEDVAKMAVNIIRNERIVKENESFNPVRIPIPKTSEMSEEALDGLIKEDPNYGVIICRCEQVSKGEILAALSRSVPANSVDGVKRRVRAGMGRCQGGFCGPQVGKIIAENKHIPLNKVIKSTSESYITVSETKGEG